MMMDSTTPATNVSSGLLSISAQQQQHDQQQQASQQHQQLIESAQSSTMPIATTSAATINAATSTMSYQSESASKATSNQMQGISATAMHPMLSTPVNASFGPRPVPSTYTTPIISSGLSGGMYASSKTSQQTTKTTASAPIVPAQSYLSYGSTQVNTSGSSSKNYFSGSQSAAKMASTSMGPMTTGGHYHSSSLGTGYVSMSGAVSTASGPQVVHTATRVDHSQQRVIAERVIEHEVKVPKKITREDVVEKVIVVPEKIVHEEVIEDVHKIRERIVEVAMPVIQEKIVEVPEIEYVERIVEVPEVIIQEKIREVPRIDYQERIIEVVKPVIQEKIVEVPEIEYRDVPYEKVVEVPEIREQVVIREIPVPQYIEKPVADYVDVHQEQEVIRTIPVPVEAITTCEFKLPRLRATPKGIDVPLYVPRFVEVPIPMDAMDSHTIAQAEAYATQVSMLAASSAVSLCDVENMASSLRQANFEAVLNTTDHAAMINQYWTSGRLQVDPMSMVYTASSATTAEATSASLLETHTHTGGIVMHPAQMTETTTVTTKAVQPSGFVASGHYGTHYGGHYTASTVAPSVVPHYASTLQTQNIQAQQVTTSPMNSIGATIGAGLLNNTLAATAIGATTLGATTLGGVAVMPASSWNQLQTSSSSVTKTIATTASASEGASVVTSSGILPVVTPLETTTTTTTTTTAAPVVTSEVLESKTVSSSSSTPSAVVCEQQEAVVEKVKWNASVSDVKLNTSEEESSSARVAGEESSSSAVDSTGSPVTINGGYTSEGTPINAGVAAVDNQ